MSIDIDKIQTERISQIQNLFSQQAYDRAIQESDDLLRIIGEPSNTTDTIEYSFLNLDEFLLFTVLFKNSIKKINKKIVWSKSQTSFVLSLKSSALYELGRYSEAAEMMRKAIKFDPVNLHNRFEFVETLLKLERYEDARKELQKIYEIVLYPDDVARMYRRFGYVYTELKEYDVAIACYVWSMQFEASDSALNEIVYIQSLRTGKKDPQYIASTIPSVLDPKATMKSLHKERLLLFFFNERKQYLLAQETQKAKDAIALYQKLGLLKDDNSSHSSSVLDTGEPIVNTETVPKASQQGESTMQNKPKSSFRDFLNKYRK